MTTPLPIETIPLKNRLKRMTYKSFKLNHNNNLALKEPNPFIPVYQAFQHLTKGVRSLNRKQHKNRVKEAITTFRNRATTVL